jgi:hypothetical protein
MVGRDSKVVLIDSNSFQVNAQGVLHLCEVGVSHFTPPELQSLSSFDNFTRTTNHGIPVASEWRSKCAPLEGGLRPARANARETIPSMATEPAKPAQGARRRTNTRRVVQGGRPPRRYRAMASPTSTGNGSWRQRPPLPRTVSNPSVQSTSFRHRCTTSPARSPKQASKSKIL